ncbi:hypothetical protein [Paenibacillus abyssi]|uniref:Uncharacterized protein n=1 Tax=Paenibacillus abyssi TaxID=1340531 RepID=A0A917LHJ4_9BACL|nr:hypothetical protein [Paenibacillus abyssi]GGG25275.1 hypothetical protein GCM10010916_47160 [Paenibacillus abyssi]
MNPSDKDLRRELESEPFVRNGFDHKLQRKILEQAGRIDQPRRRGLQLIWAGGALSIALLFTIFMMYGLDGQRAGETSLATQTLPSAKQAAPDFVGAGDDAAFHSALLIGLRTDYPAQAAKAAYSTYRTLLIAPEDGKLITAAEGEGILMPYKMDFWRIEPVSSTKQGKEVQILSASSASEGSSGKSSSKSGTPSTSAQNITEPLLVSEKLLFAGNRNLAVEQKVSTAAESGEMTKTYVWVKQIEQLSGNRQTSYNPALEPHVSLQEIFPSQAVEGSNHNNASLYSNWTIIRKPGRWVAQEAVWNASSSNPDQFTLKDLLLPLPKEVAVHDTLAVAWEEIWQRQPNAVDAYSSPSADTVVVLTDKVISFYLNGIGLALDPALVVELEPAESVIMVQWATGHYVERWKQQGQKLLVPQVETEKSK